MGSVILPGAGAKLRSPDGSGVRIQAEGQSAFSSDAVR